MGVPDPALLLTSKKLDYKLHSTLVARLNENNAWKLVAAATGFLSPVNILEIGNASPSPAMGLFTELHIRNCSVGRLCNLLEQCNLYNILALLKETEPIVIIKQPADVNSPDDVPKLYVHLGGELHLECQAKGLPPPEYVWYCNKNAIPDQTAEKLHLLDFRAENVGQYYCCVSHTHNERKRDVYSVHVDVQIDPALTVVEQPKDSLNCLEGEDITITFVVHGYPAPEYQWYHENLLLPDAVSSDLTIQSAKIHHSGEYKCFARNINRDEVCSKKTVVKVSNNRYEPTEKVALLVANDVYEESQHLKTPINDVTTLANKLTILGFKVLALQNLSLSEMKTAVNKFCQLLPEDSYALFYYAGHGFQMQDNYMLPVDAPGIEKFLRIHSLCEKEIIRDVLKTKPKLFVTLLDMCLRVPNIEENPDIHLKEHPVVFTYESERNLIQGYGTSSNQSAFEKVGDSNGIYMKHLNELILQDTPIQYLLDNVAESVSHEVPEVKNHQMPSFHSQIVGSFYLNDNVKGDKTTETKFNQINHLAFHSMNINFDKVDYEIVLQFSPLSCFQNAMKIKMSHLESWHVVCEANIKDLIQRENDSDKQINNFNNDLVVIIKNLQKIDKPLLLKISLYNRDTGEPVDHAEIDLKWPLITNLWHSKSECTS